MDAIKEPSIDKTENVLETSNVFEPETFDTWTIISDPLNLNKSETNEYNNGSRIEILNDNVEHKENYGDRTEIKYEKDSEYIDELSDGISIISDSESAGRSSPITLYTSENNYNEKESNKTKETQYEQVIPTTLTKDSFPETTSIVNNCVNRCCQDIYSQSNNLPLTEISSSSSFCTTRNLSLIFYLSASIAIIAFIGKMKYPELGNRLQGEVINQRVDDLELQNNLLRAEIDILSKQVQYLNKETEIHTKSDTVKKHNDNKNYVKKEKIKVWPGNGRIERTEIPKKALKMPHSYDHCEEKFEGVCMDSESNKNSDIHSQQFHSNLDSGNINDKLKNIIIESVEKNIPGALHENILNNIKTNEKNRYDNGKFSQRNSEINDKQRQHNGINQTNEKISETNFNDKWEKPNKKENYKNKGIGEDSRNRETQPKEESIRNTNNEKTPHKVRNKYESPENKENYKNNDNIKDYENNSKEKYHNKKNNKYKKKINDFKKSDEYFKQKKYDKQENTDWHENMMKNREEYRKQHNEKLKSENWYIDRASGREEARIFEKDQPKFKKMRRQ